MTTLKDKASDSTLNINISNDLLLYEGILLMDVIEKFKTPLRLFYLPKVSHNISSAIQWFSSSIEKHNYEGNYHYCYCTKSSHFKFIMDRVLTIDVHLEISHENDIEILNSYVAEGKLKKKNFIICNGHKSSTYIDEILNLHEQGYNIIPILDSVDEFSAFANGVSKQAIDIGLRIATEENTNKSFKISRLGIEESKVLTLAKDKIQNSSSTNLKMLHFFMNTGLGDTESFWKMLTKCLELYAELRSICPTLDSINLGGGLPTRDRLEFEFDYEGFIDKIINKISAYCAKNRIKAPDLFTEFGSFSLRDSCITIFKVTDQKIQGDEKWSFVNGSLLNSLPDIWGLKQKFLVLPLNAWERDTEDVNIGGITCDIDDYYSQEQHKEKIELPQLKKEDPLYIGFFNTAAYQDALSGYGGYHHCLVESPIILVIDEENDKYIYKKIGSNDNQIKMIGY